MPQFAHIDANPISRWLPELTAIKGGQTRPQEMDLGAVSCVLDVGQGGFCNERAHECVTSSGSLAGLTSVTSPTNIDTRVSQVGEICQARIHHFCKEVEFDAAGAAAMGNNRYMLICLKLQDSTGLVLPPFVGEMFELNTNKGTYIFNATKYGSLLVPSDYRVLSEVTSQNDWSGGGGAAVFPANTTSTSGYSYTLKAKGGQIPL